MFVLSDYYNKFVCIGGSCQDNCCAAGWGIVIDKETSAYYEGVSGEFGERLRNNLQKTDQGDSYILLTEDKRCPFLNENGLCQIYRNLGDEHMSVTCKTFPRIEGVFGNVKIKGLGLSCGEVLRIIWEEQGSLGLVCEYEPGEKSFVSEELPAGVRYMMWGGEYMQEKSVPFHISLGVAAYIGLNAASILPETDSRNFSKILEQVPDVEETLKEVKRTFDQKELYQMAENVVFYVVDTFCQVMKESTIYDVAVVLWDEAVYGRTDEERRRCIRRCLEQRNEHPEHTAFIRKLAVAFLFARAIELSDETVIKRWFMENFMNYLILAAVLPLIWDETAGDGRYFLKMARLGRIFEHASFVHEYIYPVLQDVFHLDEMSYILAFMVLFDNESV